MANGTSVRGRGNARESRAPLIDKHGGARVTAASVAANERYGDRLFHHGRADELRRLLALATAFDAASKAQLATLGIGRGWRCLDIGAGAGTLTRWLADQVGERGQVVAVDRDASFLDGLAGHPAVRVVEADVTADDFAPGSFDLVHARFLLMHLRERDRLLARMASWVRPGGLLVVSDSVNLGTPPFPRECCRRTLGALWLALVDTIGTDVDQGRRYPAALVPLGLHGINAAVDLPVASARATLGEFWRITIAQMRPHILATGHASPSDIDGTLDYFTDAAAWDLGLAMMSAWGTRAL